MHMMVVTSKDHNGRVLPHGAMGRLVPRGCRQIARHKRAPDGILKYSFTLVHDRGCTVTARVSHDVASSFMHYEAS